ncbi:hypothetical protein [Iningainema tapete]|uniref:Histidine kinase n=1 Tax=Iningainema tapete BLCC-T55 TaxID=2748662 RepID=A0A8J6XPT0_9CYAN|nr:hypothetical protein [Iningainema tapete]MBD2775101.1 hypothetical protein [Iningainema tapete BLCC-T55]
MQRFLKSFVTISVLSSLVITPLILSGGQASAQPIKKKGTDASYVGGGFAAGVTNGGKTGDAATFGGNLTGRVKLGPTPFSARTHVLWSDETTAIIPQLSVDAPIAKNTNLYLGAGYSFVENNGKPTPLGNQDAFAVTAGVETEVGKNFLVYSNATVGVNAYQNSPASAVSVNGGVGYRFK